MGKGAINLGKRGDRKKRRKKGEEEEKKQEAVWLPSLTGNAARGGGEGRRVAVLKMWRVRRGEGGVAIMTSFNTPPPTRRLPGRGLKGRNAQLGGKKKPQVTPEHGSRSASVSCCNKNGCQVCEPRFRHRFKTVGVGRARTHAHTHSQTAL